MDLETLKTNIQANGLDLSGLKGFYSFDTFSGGLFFNNLYSDDAHVVNGNADNIRLDYYPLISTVSDTCSANLVSGSGYFNESEKLKIGSGVDFDNWTILFNLNNPDYNNSNGNQASVILSSQDSGDSTSGFSIGVNDSDRLYVQYTPSGGNKATFTHDSFVGENAVYSVSKNDSIFSVNKHDFRNELNIVNLFTSSGYNKSEDWRFGDFTNSSANFTGFSGYLTDVAIFDSYLTPSQANTISRSYIQKSKSQGGVTTGFYSGFITTFNEVTGVSVTTTGITGSGITGYQTAYLGYNVDSCSGNTISGYFSSGVEGPLLGLQNNYLTGSNLISGTGFVFVSGTESIDYQATKQLSANSILFNKSVSSSDVYEVYSYNTHFKDLNLRPDYLSNENGYFLDIDSKDINYTGGNVNAYRSGYFYYSGTGFSITEDTLKFTNLPTSNQSSENVVYNYILGDQVAFPSDLSFTGYNGVISGTGANYLNKDVYFSHNGSYDMTKLVSGLDWSGQSNRFEIDATNRGSGIYVFAPMAAQAFNRATGNADYLINLDFRLTNEEIWLNGVKQLRGVDYLLVDSGQKGINAGLVNTFTRVSFNDNLNNWNI